MCLCKNTQVQISLTPGIILTSLTTRRGVGDNHPPSFIECPDINWTIQAMSHMLIDRLLHRVGSHLSTILEMQSSELTTVHSSSQLRWYTETPLVLSPPLELSPKDRLVDTHHIERHIRNWYPDYDRRSTHSLWVLGASLSSFI